MPSTNNLRAFLAVGAILVLAASASAQSTSAVAPPLPFKFDAAAKDQPPADRQGGDTIATATPITSLPYVGSGTTVSYNDDYDVACPSPGAGASDVVYSFTRPEYGTLTIDLCGSHYDTKVYVMNAGGQIFDCNDDYHLGDGCGDHTSRIDNLWLPGGETYYLVIDGSYGLPGAYQFEMRRWEPGGSVNEGDTIETALLLPGVPFHGTGNTAGYTDDYDEVCPYTGSTAPDVVYKYVPTTSMSIDIDFCASGYDTKAYVYDAGLNLIACNDDFYFAAPCFVYSSKLENVAMTAGQTYYIVIDGYGSTSGPYVMDIMAYAPCVISCPYNAYAEWEPPLIPNYVDLYNGGCNTTPSYPFQHISGASPGSDIPVCSAIFCGVSGWFLVNGSNSRDTDWFTLTKATAGTNIEITADAEYASYIFQLTGTCAGGVTVAQQAIAGPCQFATMSIAGPASTYWFWVGPTVFVSPDGTMMYDYVVWFTGLQPEVYATAPTTWSTVKALYR